MLRRGMVADVFVQKLLDSGVALDYFSEERNWQVSKGADSASYVGKTGVKGQGEG